MDLLGNIKQSIIGMDREKVVELTRKALDEGIKPERLLDEALTPGMDVVGQEYENDIWLMLARACDGFQFGTIGTHYLNVGLRL